MAPAPGGRRCCLLCPRSRRVLPRRAAVNDHELAAARGERRTGSHSVMQRPARQDGAVAASAAVSVWAPNRLSREWSDGLDPAAHSFGRSAAGPREYAGGMTLSKAGIGIGTDARALPGGDRSYELGEPATVQRLH